MSINSFHCFRYVTEFHGSDGKCCMFPEIIGTSTASNWSWKFMAVVVGAVSFTKVSNQSATSPSWQKTMAILVSALRVSGVLFRSVFFAFMMGMTVVAGAFKFRTFSRWTLDCCVMCLSSRLFCSGTIQRNTAFFFTLPRNISPFDLLTLYPSFSFQSFELFFQKLCDCTLQWSLFSVRSNYLLSVYTKTIFCCCEFVYTVFLLSSLFP